MRNRAAAWSTPDCERNNDKRSSSSGMEPTRCDSSPPGAVRGVFCGGPPSSAPSGTGIVNGGSRPAPTRSGSQSTEPMRGFGHNAQAGAPGNSGLTPTVAAAPSGGASSSMSGAVLEGPLPPEVLQVLRARCANDVLDQAESYSRRLLSTRRRHVLYSNELESAQAEAVELRVCLGRSKIIAATLQREESSIDEKIRLLQQEKELCAMQLRSELASAGRHQQKLDESGARVGILHETVERMRAEIQRATLVLQQLVPELDYSRYV